MFHNDFSLGNLVTASIGLVTACISWYATRIANRNGGHVREVKQDTEDIKDSTTKIEHRTNGTLQKEIRGWIRAETRELLREEVPAIVVQTIGTLKLIDDYPDIRHPHVSDDDEKD